MSVKKIVHKGQTILVADYRGLNNAEQQIQNLEELSKILKSSPSSLLILSNFDGVSIGSEYMNKVKPWGKDLQPKIKRQALLGITGLKNILLQGYIIFTGEKDIKAFNTEAEALEYLTK
jgi:hypothetical protein